MMSPDTEEYGRKIRRCAFCTGSDFASRSNTASIWTTLQPSPKFDDLSKTHKREKIKTFPPQI